MHWMVVWLQVVVAVYKNQHRSFVESDAPPVSLQGGAACVGREGPTSPEELYNVHQGVHLCTILLGTSNVSEPKYGRICGLLYVCTRIKEHLSGARRN